MTENKILLNKKFQAKISFHRSCTVQLRDDVYSFFEDNLDIQLPQHKSEFLNMVEHGYENYITAYTDFPYLIKMYYTLGSFGESFGTLYQNEKGHYETHALAHVYSKHRLDPVWNYRKSNLIRNIYREYLKETLIHENYHPIHMVLTVPRVDGKFKGKRFYGKELIEDFKLLRRSEKWKKMVYAGEYGIEVKSSPNKKNGMHIHIHSLVFLQNGVRVNDFRAFIRERWEKLTGGTKIHAETIYFYQKGENGKYITEQKMSKDLDTYEQDDGTYTSLEKFITVRKKFYVDDYKRETYKRTDISFEEKKEIVLNVYLYGILECIKYHFKNDALKNEWNEYDFQLIEEVLENTKGKRLYSRFGQFYKETKLSFNHLEDDEDGSELMASSRDESINPYTGETTSSADGVIVLYYAEKQKRASSKASEPYKLLNYKQNIYFEIARGKPIKEVLKEYMKNKFKPKLKIKHYD